jgi:hypothetical protein
MTYLWCAGLITFKIPFYLVPPIVISFKAQAFFYFETIKIEKQESLKTAQHDKIENVAGSVWLSLFMHDTGMCRLPPMLPGTS